MTLSADKECEPSQAIRPLRWNPTSWPMYVRVLLGVVLGTAVGIAFGRNEIAFSWTTAELGVIATLYIQLLTALATPLIFFAILDAFVRTDISGRQGMKMVIICAINIAVAFAIGLTILNVWQPGRTWQGTLEERSQHVSVDPAKALAQKAKQVSLSPLGMLQAYIPKSVAEPFTDNMVLTVAVLAILVGSALRSTRQHDAGTEISLAVKTFEQLTVAAYQIVLKILGWIIELAPYAIFCAVAGVIGGTGPGVFRLVAVFFVTVVLSLTLHSLVYYPLSAWLVGGKSPRTFFGEGLGAILTGFSINSSLATAPLTLQALQRMGVSDTSARLSACVGTNFNNDGITLYEAITALFIAQAAGFALPVSQQIAILLAALAGSMGIAGIPNSGLIILTLVLNAAGLPERVIQLALPIVLSIDFINARLRSAVNVMGDMQVAILLDAGKRPQV